MLNRKKFLWYSLIGIGGSLMSCEYISKVTHFEKVIADILTENLEGLKVSPSDISDYARDVTKNNALNFSFAGTQMLCLYDIRSFQPFLQPLNKKYTRLCTDITANFLLSTDFFMNKMDEKKTITYSGSVYSVYRSACANPFSVLYYKA